jgi:antitoxin (DNA-binding transcriptional repressor) of toxin-antitoxin stability system
LFKAAENGALVTICRRGVPVVDIVRIVRIKKPTRKKRTLETLRGKIQCSTRIGGSR